MLASPFVGVSNDALALIRRAASKPPALRGIEHSLPPQLAERDQRLLRAFRQRFDRLRDAMTRLSLERLCERIVSEHDYDLAVLAQWDGRRRYANMRKLARLARSFEELRGPDVEGFVRFVAEQEALGARELEAVAEEEGADAVRLLTIHAAKGLEFKVVIVADAGRDKAPPSADEILALSDGRFGFRVADPVTTKRRGAFDYEDDQGVAQGGGGGREAAPLLRRDDAREGAADRLRRDRPREEGRREHADRLGARPPRRGRGGRRRPPRRRVEIDRGDARFVVQLDRYRPAEPVANTVAEPEAGQLALFADLAEAVQLRDRARPAAARRACGAAAAPAAPPLVHGALDVRAVLVQVLRDLRGRMKERRPEHVPGVGDGGLRATEIGDAVHRLLEQVDLAAPALARPRAGARVVPDRHRRRARADPRRSSLVLRLRPGAAHRGARRRAEGAALHVRARRRAAARLRRRDASRRRARDRRRLQDEPARRAAPAEIVEDDYRLQRLVYALACFRAGAQQVEVVYHFLERVGRRRLDDLHAPSRCRRSRPSSRQRSSASTAASSGRRRATSRARAARRSTSCAPGLGFGAMPPALEHVGS